MVKIMSIKILFLIALFFFPPLVHSSNTFTRQNAFLHELESVNYMLSLNYAPIEWKREYLNWNAEIALEEAKSKLIPNMSQSMRDYQRIYRNFLGSLQDYHVGVLFYSSEYSTFPLQVKSVDGRYFISEMQCGIFFSSLAFVFDWETIDFEKIGEEFAKFNIGDELLSIDDIPVATIIENLIDSELFGDRSLTGYTLAERMLFNRMGKYGQVVPKGDFSISVQNQNKNKPITCQLAWLHAPEWVTDPQAKKLYQPAMSITQSIEKVFAKDFSVKLAKDLIQITNFQNKNDNENDEEDDDENDDWREKGFLPKFGTVIWETTTESEIYAYLFKGLGKNKIGYLYIPHFAQYGEYAEDLIKELGEILKKFESETDALIIDINDNPGGNGYYMYAILSMLTNKPLVNLKSMETLIPEDIYYTAILYNHLKKMEEMLKEEKIKLPNSLSGYFFDEEVLHEILTYSKSLLNQWDLGLTQSERMPLLGLSSIQPNKDVHYTKPILLLINELDFSCGDLFSAILKDNDRAILFGRKTAGAGGYVQHYKQSSLFGVFSYTMTGSLVYRQNGDVIENLGVMPDIPYKITKRDLQQGYVDYISAVHRELYRIIQRSRRQSRGE